ncbi:hypothetical protein MXB_2570 [Myxobolus squamalis]|nr:hypothetical protein MXB_2570 [Myxobolus squamalis]
MEHFRCSIALIVNVPSQHGIYSSLFGGFINFLFGTSKDVSIGPTLLGGVICSRYNQYGSPIVVAIISFFSGIVFLIMSFINMGFVMEFISYPVLTGWITSGAITIFISQLPSWFGLKIPNFTILSSYELFFAVIENISQTKLGDMAVGSACFLISCSLYFTAPVINKFHKASTRTCSKVILSALSYILLARVGWIIIFSSIVSNILVKIYGWENHFSFLPPTLSKLPPFTNPFISIEVNGTTVSTVEIIKQAYPSFILVPIVVMIETLAGARNFAKQFSYQVDNNQELMCLGLVNVLNSFFEGFPVGGALARTSVNALSGCKSLFSGLITSVLLIPTMLYLMSYISYISKAAIGASICAAALTQVQLMSLKNLWQISKYKFFAK